jgi:hypothetical protein
VVVNYGCIAPGARQAAVGESVAGLRVDLLPNPVTNGQLLAVVEGAEGQFMRARLMDLKGQVVLQESWSAAEARQRIEWDISSKPAGLYLLDIQAGNRHKTVKVVKED